nr:PREDICTED: uncharacterized protein LOC109042323 isoform X3 [Bemisia tabaci]
MQGNITFCQHLLSILWIFQLVDYGQEEFEVKQHHVHRHSRSRELIQIHRKRRKESIQIPLFLLPMKHHIHRHSRSRELIQIHRKRRKESIQIPLFLLTMKRHHVHCHRRSKELIQIPSKRRKDSIQIPLFLLPMKMRNKLDQVESAVEEDRSEGWQVPQAAHLE